jgi:hypothetical protein
MTALRFRPTHVEGLRRSLRRHRLMPLVRIARPVLRFAPGAEKVLRVPHARADAMTVAQAALDIARALRPHGKLLASAGVSKTFMADLQSEARQLALAAKTTAAARQKQVKATRAIAQEFRKAMETVTMIEGMVMLHFAKSPAMLDLWRNRRRVSARIGRPPSRKNRRAATPTASATIPEAPNELPPEMLA